MKSSPELPGPVGRAEPKGGDNPAVAGQPRRGSSKAALYVILPLVFFGSLIRLFPIHSVCIGRLRSTKPRTIEERVEHILRTTPLIDGHNDLAIFIRAFYNNHIYNETFSEPFAEGGLRGHVDIPRLQAGMNGGAFWSVFWPCPANGSDYSDENYHSIVQQTLQQIDLLARLRHSHPSIFAPPTLTSTEALDRFLDTHHHTQPPQRQPPKLIGPLGVEGLHQIGNSVAILRQFHALGVRYATLTHNCGNRFADAALHEHPLRRAEPVWHGVSPAGRRMVREMNRLGMMVDLAHASVDTMRDVLGGGGSGWEGSAAPVVFSHSSVYALCPHPRNVPDGVLDLVGRRGGLVMVNFNPGFISCVEAPGRGDGLPEFYPANATLHQVVRHVLYIGERIGFDHVGLGSDFAGIVDVPEGLEDVSKFPDLIAELLRQGVSDRDAAKVVGGNILRVWGEVEAVAREMQKKGEPVLEDDLPRLFAAGYRGTEREL
ncbi:membrane dipeptidase-domain-containing protein [Chaetomium tenue]|uniref:Membrane dipeptidase-domain-containing protein n=1 Tax=Chaetomium tenue TaxID=1854479 RepID=A0ACB7PGE3_9PEZI|nr:membrane dipeptidase-domain-containing protein [Chaetomium globosum]